MCVLATKLVPTIKDHCFMLMSRLVFALYSIVSTFELDVGNLFLEDTKIAMLANYNQLQNL